jgi:putative transposase
MRKSFIETGHPQLSVRRQSELCQVNRNRLSPEARCLDSEELELCREIDEIHMKRPYYGSRRITKDLQARGYSVGRCKIRRLMRHMGLVAIYPKPRTTLNSPENRVFPYLLRNREVTHPNEVWCSDITYIPMARGYAYLVVIMDWYSRAVLGWRISNTLDTSFCLEALADAREQAGCWPEIMNTDQGCQYTSHSWTHTLLEAGVQVSMDGRGQWVDNVFVERLWRSLKYEDIYLREYLDIGHLERGVAEWLSFYNQERPHQAHNYKTPWAVWLGEQVLAA